MKRIKQLSAQGNSAANIIKLAQSDRELHQELERLVGFAGTGKIALKRSDECISPIRAQKRLSAQASYAMRLPLTRKTNPAPISDL